MKKRVLLGGCDIPGWGGAATRQYHLFERMQRDGFDVVSLSMVREMDELFLRRTTITSAIEELTTGTSVLDP